MFDFIRTHQKLMQIILFVLIVPPFAFLGGGRSGFGNLFDHTEHPAKVAGQPITQQQLEVAHQQSIDRMIQSMGNIDRKLLDTPEFRERTLSELIDERVMANVVVRDRIVTSDAKIADWELTQPAFQENGKFSIERATQLMEARSGSKVAFEAGLRSNLTIQQLTSLIPDSSFVPKKIAEHMADVQAQERDVSSLVFKPADFSANVKLPADAVQKYYDQHADDFKVQEQIKAEYIVLSRDQVAAQVQVPADQVSAYYDANKKRYNTPEQRRASHILIKLDDKATDADKKKAHATAEEVLAKAKANPADFAKLAKQYSQDPGSAANGGDLDYFSSGAMVPSFDKAVFSMKEKEISNIVESQFGYHIIMLTGIRPAGTKSLDMVRGEIEAELRKPIAAKKFLDVADSFSSLVNDQSDSLKPAADKFGLKVETVDNLTRTAAPTTPALNNPKFLTALFSADSIKNRRNTEALETMPGTLVSARVLDYKPSVRRPLAEVEAQIKSLLIDKEARKLAADAAKAKLAELQKSTAATADLPGFSPVKTITRTAFGDVSSHAVPEIFKADTTHLPAYTTADLDNGEVAVYRISRIGIAKNLDANQRNQAVASYGQQFGELESISLLNYERKRADVEVSKTYANVLKPKADDKKPAE